MSIKIEILYISQQYKWSELKAHTHTPVVEELALEFAFESADYNSQSADSKAAAHVGMLLSSNSPQASVNDY